MSSRQIDASGTYHASYIIVPTAFGAAHLGQVVRPSAPPGLGCEDPVVFTAVVGVQKSKLNVYAPMWYPSDGEPVDGALVEIWQCDAQGIYDHPLQPGRDKRDSAFQGYGRLLVKADGRYSFRTLKPVAYIGRSPHIHFKVVTSTGKMLTSQFYIAGDPGNDRDGVFRGIRDTRQRELVEMKLAPAPGVEAGALATSMDIVVG